MSNAWTLCCVVLLVLFSANAIKPPISFDDALHSAYMPDLFNGSWISEINMTQIQHQTEDKSGFRWMHIELASETCLKFKKNTEYLYEVDYSGEMVKYNVETGSVTTVVNKTLLEAYNISEVTTSADGKWLAIGHDDTSVFRHSKKTRFTLYELETGTKVEVADGQRIQLMVWAPVGQSFAYVLDNDVFYQSVHYPTRNTQRITNSSDTVFNGIADWVYEEEVLEDTKALWFSPDGKKMVFTSMDDTNVRNVTLWRYNDPGSLESQYVEQVVIRYPKTGTTNPTTTLNYVDLEQTPVKYKAVSTPVDLVSNDNVLASVAWASNTHFSPTWLTRLQTKGYTLLCNSLDLKCTQMLEYVENKGWLDTKPPIFKNQTAFFAVLPRDQGSQNGNYRQLCLVSADLTVVLTSGLDVVIDIGGYDNKTGIVYYTATANHDSAQRHVYAISDDGKGVAKCLSCADGCQYGSATFSHGASYYVLSCLGPRPPSSDLYSKEGRLIKHLVDNKILEEGLKNVDLPVKKDLDVPVANGFTAKVRLYLPSSLQEDGKIKYPVLFNVYSGPNSNKISDMFKSPAYDEYLVTSRGIIIVNMDGRGSGLRGDNIKFEMYHKLGGPEIEDIFTVAKYLQTNLPYVDAKRIAIWGWSYGGYATAMTLAKDTDQLFKCGISVAPVTNWLYYDTIYTERYMGLPTNDSNLEGYKVSDVTTRVENFRHKMYYLIHGNADDNVHYQQSMMLSKALEHADILFYQQSYPDETHALAHVRRHLYHSMDKFWTKCFRLKEPIYKEHYTRDSSSRGSNIGNYDYSSSSSSSGSQVD